MQYYSKLNKISLLDPLRKEYGDRNRDRTQDEKQSLLGVNEHRSPSVTTSSDARRTFAAGLVIIFCVLFSHSVRAVSESEVPFTLTRPTQMPQSEENSYENDPSVTRDQVSTETLKATAFDNVVQNVLPLSPKQIEALRKIFNQTKAAEAMRTEVPPRPVISSRPVNLTPGSIPTTVRLSQGYISTLAFVDSTGQPWPLDNYSIGNPQAFNVQWDKKGNVLMILATELYQDANLVVQLRNLATPVVLSLLTGQPEVDARLDLHISGQGPYAKPLLGQSEPAHIKPTLMSVLDGISPPNSSVLQILGADAVQAWAVKDRIYLRTRLTLLSPAWLAVLSAPDGMKAYELPKTPLIIAAVNGRPVQLKVQGL